MSVDTVVGSVPALEKELSLPEGFFNSLKDEDDWSFIIKIHALIEAAVSCLLTQKFGHDELLPIFSRLELSNKKTGKISFISALELLNKDERRFISSLSELRNLLVHNVSNVSFDLKGYALTLKQDKRRNFVLSFWYGFDGVVDLKEGITIDDVVLEDPKKAISASALVFLAIIYQVKELEKLKREADTMATQFAKTIRSNNPIKRIR